MSDGLWIGAVLATAGGAMQGAFALPMKYTRKWKHENIWLVFAVSGFVILPWMLVMSTIPHWLQIYRSSPVQLVAIAILCGVGWGIGAALVGVAFRVLGIGLSFAIILGLSSLLGSLIPFIFQSRHSFASRQGILYIMSTVVMLTGIAIVSAAGSRRDREIAEATTGTHTERRFLSGLGIAIAAGVLSSLMSYAIAFTQPIVNAALDAGTNPVWATNVVLVLLTSGGVLANAVYCLYEMRKNKSAALYLTASTGSYWFLGILMGAFWYGGLMLYGLSEQRIGTVTGWPLFIGAMILSSSVVGFLTGEWKGAGKWAKAYLCIGSLVIFAALIFTGMAQNG